MCFANDLYAANWNVTHRKNKSGAETHRGINGRLHPQAGCGIEAVLWTDVLLVTNPPVAEIVQHGLVIQTVKD